MLRFYYYKFRFKISLGFLRYILTICLQLLTSSRYSKTYYFLFKFYRFFCKKFNNVTLFACHVLPRENYQHFCNKLFQTYLAADDTLMKISNILGKFSPLHLKNYAVNNFWLLNKFRILIFQCREDVMTHFSYVILSYLMARWVFLRGLITFYASNFTIG